MEESAIDALERQKVASSVQSVGKRPDSSWTVFLGK